MHSGITLSVDGAYDAAFLGNLGDRIIKLATFWDGLHQEQIYDALKYSLLGELTRFLEQSNCLSLFCIFIKCVNCFFE